MTEPGRDEPPERGRAAAGWRAWPPVAALFGSPVATVAGLLLLAVLVLEHRAIVQWGAARYAGLVEWVSGPRLPGVLAIEPPQLYTRERLVNDRFRQANWLEAELEKTTGDEALTAAGRPTASERTDRRSVIGLFLGGEGNDGNGAGAASDIPADRADIAASRALALKEIDRLRLSLRTELMDTLLDDGHDLQGNTLYRLNFDAVVMPFLGQRSYPGTAVFVIEALNPFAALESCLRKDVLGEAGAECPRDAETNEASRAKLEATLTRREEDQVADDLELLRNWQREIQQFLTRVVEARTRDFRQNGFLVNPVDPKENIALDRYLRLRLIEAFLDAAARLPEVARICAPTEYPVACKEWIAASIGSEWRRDNRVPDFVEDDPRTRGVEKAFRESLGIAQIVNQVRAIDGDPMLGRNDVKLLGDLEQKQALIRLIAVWDGLGTWLAGQSRRAAAADWSPVQATADDRRADDASQDRDRLRQAALFGALGRFGDFLPTDADIATLRAETREVRNASFERIGRDGIPFPVMPLTSPVERCRQDHAIAAAGPRPDPADEALIRYRCLFLNASTNAMTDDLIAQFVLERLQNNLDPYDKEDRSIQDFLRVSLEGCAITGCRIQVRKYDDVAVRDLLPAQALAGSDGAIGAERAFPDRVVLTDGLLDRIEDILSGTDWSAQSVEGRRRLTDSRLCLRIARKYAGLPDDRAEVYFACSLRHWVDTKRSPLTVYGVSPRAGEGDDLLRSTSRVQEQDRVGLALDGRLPAEVSGNQVASRLRDNVLDNPSVIGFSNLPDETSATDEENYDDTAIFGWAIRPQELPTGGYSSSHHRLSAVVSLPSWWKRVEFLVHGCWVTATVAQRAGAEVMTNPKALCAPEEAGTAWWRFRGRTGTDAAQSAGGPVLERRFEIKLPRRVEEVTARFNFDFIKAPYYYQDFDEEVQRRPVILTLEAGRPGQLALAGERLWRGTVVTVNNQTADRIVVLPDMKGVVAQFDCVNPPAGSRHFSDYSKPPATPPPASHQAPQPGGGPGSTTASSREGSGAVVAASGSPPEGSPQAAAQPPRPGPSQGRQGPSRPRQDASEDAPLFVWTSEGRTQMRIAKIKPFVQRYPDERPCWASSGP